MRSFFTQPLLEIGVMCALLASSAVADELSNEILKDYQQHLGALFEHFHRNPELSYLEFKTAARMAEELRGAGFEVTEGVGGTGLQTSCRKSSYRMVHRPT